jgi:hypothetical protein
VNLVRSGYGPKMGSSEHGNKSWVSIKEQECLDHK